MILFPAIDLKDGQCVRLIQGDFDQSKIYNSSPVDQAKSFEDLGIEWLHCVDLDGALEGVSKNIKCIEEICVKTKLKIQCGGGIRNEEQIVKLLKGESDLTSINSHIPRDEGYKKSVMQDNTL